jgi:hypothetical protein
VRFTRFRTSLGGAALVCFINLLGAQSAPAAGDALELTLTPRVCTLAADDTECAARVQASWRSPHPVSICLVVADRPDAGRCWDEVSEGAYALELRATGDVTFELRDRGHQLLASSTLRVVRETKRYRHKRREPWNVFD